MRTLGIAGGIGSGKTTVCRMFEELGAQVFYADDEAKTLLTRPDVMVLIRDTFGAESYHEDGTLNRAYLARQVFPNPDMLRRLNHIVHPRLFEVFGEARDEAERQGVPLFLKEAAILIESGGHRHVDDVALVDAPEDERIRRVVLRDGVTEDAVRARINNQWPAERLRPFARFVIDTMRPEAEVKQQVAAIYNELAQSD